MSTDLSYGKAVLSTHEAQQNAAKEADDYKKSLETQRYKQDCRKRALDLAHGERDYQQPSNPLERQQPKMNTPETILKNADKYYEWLISIPQ